ncbi:class I fructose-bisphosphate aldolase [Chamaesiphon sp. OTE_8_metabat_110]|uniref:class I fructose-bisphosphate aldolase n=1 Tax=Chamaesiphon sp. OTE_8_metabat_110 TaxID=2964696 RepID=UPI00286CD65C|nr:class I fructose-bisphosphate aldolase [Chamaesiphon sp. OTE_8_metabat_110]
MSRIIRERRIERVAGLIPGIEVDGGAKPFAGHPDELVTDGLDGLDDRFSWFSTRMLAKS